MGLSIGITPEQLRSRFGSVMYKLWLFVASGRKWYIYIVLVIVFLIIVYKYLDKFLFDYFKGKYEKSV